MKVNDLKSNLPTLERIKEAASRLLYYAKFRRVTHTVKQLNTLINEIALFKEQVDSNPIADHDFYIQLSKLLHLAQRGPSELRLDSEGLYISGSFDPALLRRYMLLASPPPTIYIAKGAEDASAQ